MNLTSSLFLCVQREESLRVQLKNLSEELESQRNLHRTTLKRANEAETQLKENQDRVTGLEGELLTSDVERDQLKDDKRKVRLLFGHTLVEPVVYLRHVARQHDEILAIIL